MKIGCTRVISLFCECSLQVQATPESYISFFSIMFTFYLGIRAQIGWTWSCITSCDWSAFVASLPCGKIACVVWGASVATCTQVLCAQLSRWTAEHLARTRKFIYFFWVERTISADFALIVVPEARLARILRDKSRQSAKKTQLARDFTGKVAPIKILTPIFN